MKRPPHIRQGLKIIPWPPGWPENGKGVSRTFYNGIPVCAHPDHPPHYLDPDTDTWVEITIQYERTGDEY